MGMSIKAGGVQLPVGYIFEFDPTGITDAPDLSTPAKVHDYFGYGTWEAYGSGRVTIGVSDGHVIGSEGGEENHTLISTELPSPIQSERNVMMDASKFGGFGSPIYQVPTSTYIAEVSKITIANGNQPHNNMQPYRTVYRWRRIA